MGATSADETRVTFIRASGFVAQPWKNGSGVTREIACHPPGATMDAFTWRASLADVVEAGPFSQFKGVDRTLVLLEGGGMRLDCVSGEVFDLRAPLDVAYFAGESIIVAELQDGPTRDFNLMVLRGAVRANLTIWREGPFETLGASTLLFFCAQGGADITLDTGHEHSLGIHDVLRLDAPYPSGRARKSVSGIVLAVRLYLTVRA